MNNPARAAWRKLKDHAKERKIEFKLPFKWFQIWCKRTKYLTQVGTTRFMFHIDRKNPDKGYTIRNIQVLTCAENVAKGNKERHRHKKPNIEEPNPF